VTGPPAWGFLNTRKINHGKPQLKNPAKYKDRNNGDIMATKHAMPTSNQKNTMSDILNPSSKINGIDHSDSI
jgi:hypothetical protein